MAQQTPKEQAIAEIQDATSGFDHVFANELGKAREVFQESETPLHLLGLGALSFLEAALGMEVRGLCFNVVVRLLRHPRCVR